MPLRQLTSSLVALLGEAKSQTQRARAEHEQTLAAFDDPLVRRAAEGNQDLGAALEAAREAIERDDKQAEGRLDGLGASVDAWSAEIEELRRLAG